MNKLILEEIQRMNLLANYDSSKTLSEQKQNFAFKTPEQLAADASVKYWNNVYQKAAAAAPAAAAPAAAAPAAPAAAASLPESTNKANWEDVLKYYEGNKDPNWKFNEKGNKELSGKMYDFVKVNSTDTNDTDAYMNVWDDGDVSIWNKGQGTGRSYGKWEWDGTKPIIKFKDISKNASGYVQPTDTDWSAVTTNNKIIGLNAKGPLVKKVQNKLINIGYSGTSLGSITTDVEGCKADVEKCDGIYGKSTKEMVKQYQKDNGLSVDGIVGQQTQDSMF
jgi:hypothetical protein